MPLAMWRVNAIVLVALLRTAAADPAEAPKHECKAGGAVLFEVDQRADRKAKLTTATTQLFENGAWKTEVRDVDGRLARSDSGCLASADLESVRAQLRSATWKTTRTKEACRTDQPRSTLYKWKGRLLYTERTCNLEALDSTSRRALDIIEVQLHAPFDLDAGSVPCLGNPLAKGCN
jgi:hypothetical protein